MESRGSQTEMPRAALPRDPRRSESVIWGMALGIATIFAIGQIITILAAAPAVIAFHADSPELPFAVAIAEQLGPLGIGLVMTLIDGLILVVFVALARRYWVGLAFLPPLLYLGIGSIVLWSLVSGVISAAAPS